MSADRNLLFGILALQNNFVTRSQLVEAMNAWVIARHRPLGEVLRDHGALCDDEHALIEALLSRQLARQGGDVEASLRELELSSSARAALTAVSDPGVEASLARCATPPPQATTGHVPWPGGDRLRYRVLRPHARGGLGEVFVAEDTELHREVALKEIQECHARDLGSRGRFLLEAEITGRLEHPGIVPVYGLGCYADGRPFYAMRFIKGDNLGHAIDRFHESKTGFDSVAFRQVLRRFLDVCNAVAYAHARGVLHRDLKPGNIMLGEFGETLIVDWGLAKVVGRSEPGDGAPTLRPSSGSGVAGTMAGSAIGTPAFMSPEQAEGKVDALGPATDVYSLGATLYCLLTGKAPVPAREVAEVLQKVRCGDIQPAHQVRADVPRALEAICRRAMALPPGDRYPSALALAQDVERWLADEPVSAFRDPPLVRAGRWARKHRTLVTTAAAVLLVSLAALTVGLAIVGGLNRKLEAANIDLEVSNVRLEKERTIAVAVNEFLQHDLLGQADLENQPLRQNVERDPDIKVAVLLDRAAQAIEGKFKDQPETEAAIRLTIGAAYRALSKYEQAQPHLERSLAMRQKMLGLAHADTLVSKNGLAVLYQDQGKYDHAETLLLEVLKQLEKMLGADHRETLTSKSNLALLYLKQGKYDKAEPPLLEVLQQRGHTLGADHASTLVSKTNLAVLYQAQAKYDRAEALLREVAQQLEKKLGADHPSTLNSKHELAHLYHNQSKYNRAEPLFLEVLQQQKKKLGADHPDTLLSKNNLAALYQDRGEYNKAETLFLEVLEQKEKKLGADHPDTLFTKNNLAVLYHTLDKYDRAEPLYRAVLQQQEKKLGADHPHTLTSKTNLATLYHEQCKYDDAELLYWEVVQQLEKKLGPDHPSTLLSKNNLAMLYQVQEKYHRAKPLFLEVLEQKEKKLGADHPSTLVTKNNLAMLYKDQKQYDRAEALLREVIQQQEKKLGADHPHTLNSRNNLAALYQDQKQYDKAEPLLLQQLSFFNKKANTASPDSAAFLASLGLNLLRQKKYSEAEKPLRDSLRIREKAQPEEWITFNTSSMLGEAILGQKKYADAEPLLLQGYEGMLKRQAKIPPQGLVRVTEALERLVALYDATGQKDKAAKYRHELDAVSKRVPPRKKP